MISDAEILEGVIERAGAEALADGAQSFLDGGSLRLVAQSIGLGDEEFCVFLRAFVKDLQKGQK